MFRQFSDIELTWNDQNLIDNNYAILLIECDVEK